MTTLADRIRAALDAETERLHALPPFPWKLNPDDDTEVYAADDVVLAEAWALSTQQQKRVAEHILAGSPERVLRMVAAHRQILDLHAPGVPLTRVTDGGTVTSCMSCGGWYTMKTGTEWPCDTVKVLAEAYGVEVES